MVRGLDSSQPIPVTPDYWEEKKRKLTDDQAAYLAAEASLETALRFYSMTPPDPRLGGPVVDGEAAIR